MPVRVTVNTEGLAELSESIAGMQQRARDLKPAFGIIADLLELHVAQQFATQGLQGGTPWAALKPRTVLMRTKRLGYYKQAPLGGAGPTSPVLVWTGRLRGSFRQGSGEHVRIITDGGLEWGSRVWYAGFHQSPLPRRILPRRPMVAFRDQFQQREIAFQPLRLWLQGVEPGAIRTVMMARLGLGAA